ncbi:MAG TPA: adenylyl-sulfate kinase [Candidatus Nanopelagicaceae bacterium]|nr:adenylyl-sulfate kinase [Candidatus Nanopelagicaceae bacterium]
MDNSVVRLLTCGSVDDGKSTLIGRLLVDTDSVPHDTVGAARRVRRSGSTIPHGDIDYSLLTDGLEAEREQGITIDVAYRSMSLPDGRRLIIADAPGHEQYTRNMAVAASRSDVALVLVDATRGLRTQTFRHLMICSLMGVSRIIVAINKFDAMEYSKAVYQEISGEIHDACEQLELTDVHQIPISALTGDNIIAISENMPWYQGSTLLELVQDWTPPENDSRSARFRVQLISRADGFRGVAGSVRDGQFDLGDEICIIPRNQKANIAKILTFESELDSTAGASAVTFVLEPDVDVARGDIITKSFDDLKLSDRFFAHMVWLDEEPLVSNRSYLLISGYFQTPAIVNDIKHAIDVNTTEKVSADKLMANEIGLVEITTDFSFGFLPYKQSREFGNFILVDRLTLRTVGAGMIQESLQRVSNVTHQDYEVSKTQRAAQKNQSPRVIWLTGLSGSGKSTIANALEKQLYSAGMHAYVLDGDNLRLGLSKDLGFTQQDRIENVRRVAEVAKILADAGLVVIVALVSPFENDRRRARALFEPDEFFEVFVDTPIDVCISRDPKGLYRKSAEGKILNFTGVGQEYERPSNPDLVIDGTASVEEGAHAIVKLIF